jgi:hypothetical protein
MNLEEAQDAVIERVKAVGAQYKFDVFEGSIPLGYELTKQFGQQNPYVIVTFGGQGEVQRGHQGITGTRDNLRITSVAVECVSNAPKTSRVLVGLIRDSLDGFSPDESWGQLVEQLSGEYSVRNVDYDLWPVRFARGILFEANSNA